MTKTLKMPQQNLFPYYLPYLMVSVKDLILISQQEQVDYLFTFS